MTGIEEIVRRFDSLPPASGGRWSIDTLAPGRAHLTRDDAGRYTIFLEGEEKSFGTYPKVRSIQHVKGIIPVPGGNPLSALKLTSPGMSYGNRALAHVAYEVENRLTANPGVGNADLVADVRWILELLSADEQLMSADEQRGLIGELVFLRKLLSTCVAANLPPREALARWWGWDRTKRDFAASGIAVEVKATSRPGRQHLIGSIAQLETHGDEEVFLFSVGVRMDATAPRKLPDVVSELRSMIATPAGEPDQDGQGRFARALHRYGYDLGQETAYRALPGILNFHLPPKLYRVKDLDCLRMRSFKDDRLPSMVDNVMYTLDIKAQELSSEEETVVLERMMKSAALVP